jgi:hypothetical protein
MIERRKHNKDKAVQLHVHSTVSGSQVQSPTVQSGFSRETEPMCVCVCVCVCTRVFYFKELAHITVEKSKSKICRVDQQARDPGNSYSMIV